MVTCSSSLGRMAPMQPAGGLAILRPCGVCSSPTTFPSSQRVRLHPLASLAPAAASQRWRGVGSRRLILRLASATSPKTQPTSAKEAIEAGLKLFAEEKDYVEAARLFTAATEMRANDDEMRAALYNLGCAYTKLKQWKPAADSIVRAINDHKLKLSVALKVRWHCPHAVHGVVCCACTGVAPHGLPWAVALMSWPSCLQDDDLRTLRDRREWIDALTEVKGGLSRDMKIELRSEARVSALFSGPTMHTC
jgi:hypothetical protein